VSQLKGNSGMR